MTERIKLYGERADRFQEIRDHVTEELGYTPSNAELVGLLMGLYDSTDTSISGLIRS